MFKQIGNLPYYLTEDLKIVDDVDKEIKGSGKYFHFKTGKEFTFRSSKSFSLAKIICQCYHPIENWMEKKNIVEFVDGNKNNIIPSNIVWKKIIEKEIKPERPPKRIKRKRTIYKPVILQFPVKGEKNCKAKLTLKQVEEIRETVRECPSISKPLLAKVYGIKTLSIYNIINNKYWKNV